MKSESPFLYLIVTDYPFGIGEPFLETELFSIAGSFRHIYLVMPESHRVDHSRTRFGLPANVSLIELQTKAGNKEKVRAALKWFSPAFRKERQHIKGPYKQKLSVFHMRIMIGFFSLAIAFAEKMEEVIRANGHSDEEIVLYSYWFTYATAGLACLKEKHTSSKVVTRVHGWDCFYDRNPGNYLPFRPWVSDVIDNICPVSVQGKTYLLSMLPEVDPGKINVHYLGVNSGRSLQDFSFKQGKIRLVSIAFIHHVKRIDLLIDALAKIQNIEVEWTHIGSWSPATAWLQEYAVKKLGPLRNIQYHFTGEFAQDEVHEFLSNKQADFLICTSKSEGLPVSMMEAMSYGIPVISTAVGGVPEIVSHGKNGFLVLPDANDEELKMTIEKTGTLSIEEYLILSKNAKDTYEEKFRADINFLKFANDLLLA